MTLLEEVFDSCTYVFLNISTKIFKEKWSVSIWSQALKRAYTKNDTPDPDIKGTWIREKSEAI